MGRLGFDVVGERVGQVPNGGAEMLRSVQSALIFVLLFGSFARAEEKGVLSGVVTDASGAVVPGVVIQVQGWTMNSDNHPVPGGAEQTRTDSRGKYRIQLSPGIYDVFVSSSVFGPVAKRVSIHDGAEIDFSPQLSLDPLTKTVSVLKIAQEGIATC
jgi:hypothetical protein